MPDFFIQQLRSGSIIFGRKDGLMCPTPNGLEPASNPWDTLIIGLGFIVIIGLVLTLRHINRARNREQQEPLPPTPQPSRTVWPRTEADRIAETRSEEYWAVGTQAQRNRNENSQ